MTIITTNAEFDSSIVILFLTFMIFHEIKVLKDKCELLICLIFCAYYENQGAEFKYQSWQFQGVWQ